MTHQPRNSELSLRIRMVLLICTVFVTFPLRTVAAFEYKDEVFHYKLQLPDSWVKLDQNALNAANKAASAGSATTPPFVMGFVKATGSQTVYPTYMLIEQNATKITFEKLAERFAGKGTISNQKIPNVIKESHFSEPIIDKDKKIIIIPSTQHVESVGTIKALTVLFLGNSGLVQLYLYSLEREYPVDFPVFTSIIESFSFEAGYKAAEPRISDRPSVISVLIRTILGAAVGLGIYWIIRFLVRRRTVT